jgi:hypothetical protein
MGTKIVLWLVWAGFTASTLVLAPLDQPGTLTLIEKLVKLQWADINQNLGQKQKLVNTPIS